MSELLSPENGQNLTKTERRAQKIAAREQEAKFSSLKKVFKKAFFWLLGLSIVIGGTWLIISSFVTKGADYSVAIAVLGREHIQEGTPFAGYNSNPPTSGPHYPNPAPIRFYDRALPDEQVVHNLEHGNVWISYKPNLSKEIIKILKGFSGGNTIVTPRSANDFDIALAAWGRLDKFNAENGRIDKQRIKDFIIRYQNKGPEI